MHVDQTMELHDFVLPNPSKPEPKLVEVFDFTFSLCQIRGSNEHHNAGSTNWSKDRRWCSTLASSAVATFVAWDISRDPEAPATCTCLQIFPVKCRKLCSRCWGRTKNQTRIQEFPRCGPNTMTAPVPARLCTFIT